MPNLIMDPTHHMWSRFCPSADPQNLLQTRSGEKYVTVIVDLTPIRVGIGPARLVGAR
ncbi:hypothetical protein NFC73_20635 [Pseudarthrobacter sp. RMG13]|uniref:Uncharacterized protein n=1 Tax=Pseudarthrobacter humi TaxID=2952523 RepID=A0ABT1LY64_9MICC|nr:hypothetical protein [Pseudarthrobacter humi]MCP9002111.1 hypothetical protein [Pseudarthrobacter humi]